MRDLARDLSEAVSALAAAIEISEWERVETKSQIASSRASQILTRVRVMIELQRENA